MPYLISLKDWWCWSAVVESEHVIEAEETSWTTWKKMEDLGELDWVLATINEEVTRDEAQNAVVDWGLSIEALNLVGNLAEWAELFNNASDTLELFTFETEHRIVSVQFLELLKTIIRSFKLQVCYYRKRCSSAEQTAIQCWWNPSWLVKILE